MFFHSPALAPRKSSNRVRTRSTPEGEWCECTLSVCYVICFFSNCRMILELSKAGEYFQHSRQPETIAFHPSGPRHGQSWVAQGDARHKNNVKQTSETSQPVCKNVFHHRKEVYTLFTKDKGDGSPCCSKLVSYLTFPFPRSAIDKQE